MEQPLENTWIKGMNQDVSYLKVKGHSLFELRNGSIVMDSSGSFADISYALGTEPSFSIPDVDPIDGIDSSIFQNLMIIGSGLIRDQVILVTTGFEGDDADIDTLGYAQIWKFSVDNTTDQVIDILPSGELDSAIHLMYNGLLEQSKKHRVTRLIGRWENNSIARIYLTNDFTPPRTLNLNNPDVINTPIGDTLLNPSVNHTPIVITGYGNGGSIPVGSSVQYTYRLRSEEGGQTTYSAITNLLQLGGNPATNFPANYQGSPIGQGSNKYVDLEITNIDTSYDIIELVVIIHEIEDVPQVYKFYEGVVPTNGFLSIHHDGNPNDYTPVDSADLRAVLEVFSRVKDFAVKDNRLFAFNVSINNRTLKSYDTRAYRANIAGNAVLNHSDEELDNIDVLLADITDGLVEVPEEHDCINPFNDIISIAGNHYSDAQGDIDDWMLNKQYKFNTLGELGGSGRNVDYKIISQTLQGNRLSGGSFPNPSVFPQPGNPPNANGSSDYYNFNKFVENETSFPLTNGALYNDGVTIHNLEGEWKNFKSARVTQLFKGYARGEVYRFAAVFVDTSGNDLFSSWIADIQFPRAAESGYEIGQEININSGNSSGRNRYVKTLGVEFTFRNLDQLEGKVSAIKIVRVPREQVDKTRLATGTITQMLPAAFNVQGGLAYGAKTPRVPGLIYGPQNNITSIDFYNDVDTLLSTIFGSASLVYTNPSAGHTAFGCLAFSTPDNYHRANNQSGFSGIWTDKSCLEIEGIYSTNISPIANLDYLSSGVSDVVGEPPYDNTPGDGADYYSFAMADILGPESSFIQNNSLYFGGSSSNLRFVTSFAKFFYRDIVPYPAGFSDELKRRPLRLALNDSKPFGLGGVSTNVNMPDALGTAFVSSNLFNFSDDAEDSYVYGDRPTIVTLNDWKSLYQGVTPESVITGSSYNALQNYANNPGGSQRPLILASYFIAKNRNASGVIDQYINNTYIGRQQNIYIDTGAYIPIQTGSIEKTVKVFGGDVTTHYVAQRFATTADGWGTNSSDNAINNVKSSVMYHFIESTVNLEKRHGNYFPDNEIYQGGSGFDGTAGGTDHTNGGDFPLYNPVYQQESNVKIYPALNPFANIEKDFEHNIYYSDYKLDGQVSDAWRFFRTNNFVNVEGNYGPINAGINFMDELFFLQDRSIGKLLVNERVAIPTDSGVPLTLGTGGVLEDYAYLSINSGSVHQASVVQTDRAVYYFDANLKRIGRFNKEGVSPESDAKGMHSYMDKYKQSTLLSADETPLGDGVVAGVDLNNHRVYFTFNAAGAETLVYSEVLESFEKFIDKAPILYIDAYKRMYGTLDGNLIHLFEQGIDKGEFFGDQLPMEIWFVVNDMTERVKIAKNIEWLSRCVGVEGNNINQSITEIRVMNDYQDTDWQSDIRGSFRRWRHQVQRDQGSERDRIRGSYIKIGMRFTPSQSVVDFILSNVQTNVLIQDLEQGHK